MYSLYSYSLYRVFQVALVCTGSNIRRRISFCLEATDRLCGAVGKRPRITSIQDNLSDESFVNSNPVLTADVFSFKQK